MQRKTISLAMIVKNEAKNLPRLFDSIEGCFDEVVIVDTGSTDNTKQIALDRGAKVFDFVWVNDFSAARNVSLEKATSDYVMWMDADDVLSDKASFIKWRDTAMEFNSAWFATYHYALDRFGKPIVSFMRERVFRRSLNPKFQYPIHEGVVLDQSWQPNYITTWTVNHMRDLDDIKQDKSRNISILEKMPNKDPRMKFYYGKELYEAGRPFESVSAFEDAIKEPGLQPHDRILSYQYGAHAAASCFNQLKDEFKEEKDKYFEKAVNFAFEGLKLDPNRAEFHVALGDLYTVKRDLIRAVPCFAAAKACINHKTANSPYEGAVYSYLNHYGELPSLQLIKVYLHIGLLDKAKKEALDCVAAYNNDEAKELLKHIENIEKVTDIKGKKVETEDIVFTCPPNQAYPFDEEIYKSKGLGGSETALVHMSKNLKKKTGRRVIVFNTRQEDLVSESGVEWISNAKANEYLSKYKPKAHIAWRHNIKMTEAPTYLWCHDLTTQTVESMQNFDKIMCLSQFHRDYVQAMQGVKSDKIVVTRNGLDPIKFDFERKGKDPNKVVWMSSPDRGLKACMKVMDELREEFKDLELHVYYGLENLYKYGLASLAEELKQMMAARPWVKYHGFTEQNKMYHEVSDAVLWLHPANFIETFAITAIEMLALGIYPVTRRLGALQNTLADAEKSGQAILLNHGCETEQEIKAYANSAAWVLRTKAWQKVSLDPKRHDWAKIADEWIDFMGLAVSKEAKDAA